MDALGIYLREIETYPILSREQEYDLATSYRDYNNLQAAKQLVQHNLRFVVKIAREYYVYCDKLQDLVQEGTIGLMMAVKKFNPYRGVRLLSYAVHWIRAYIQNYILKTWSLVKLGTTELQRKMFPKLRKFNVDVKEIAESLNTDVAIVEDFKNRINHTDKSLDIHTGNFEDFELVANAANNQSLKNIIPDDSPNPEEICIQFSEAELFKRGIVAAIEELNEKELFIFEHRLIVDDPLSLQEIGDKFGISRERVRQIESNLIRKLKEKLK